jgi:BlaI family transcriptional regulator, penicillinase repressor
MPSTPPPDLGDLQLAIMQVLWQRREASAAEVQAALGPERELAITTVSTILSRLERRGLVKHRTDGRLFIYHPAVSEPEVRQSMLGSLVDSLFSGDPTEVVSQLLASHELSPGDLDRMRELIDQHRPHKGKRRGRIR